MKIIKEFAHYTDEYYSFITDEEHSYLIDNGKFDKFDELDIKLLESKFKDDFRVVYIIPKHSKDNENYIKIGVLEVDDKGLLRNFVDYHIYRIDKMEDEWYLIIDLLGDTYIKCDQFEGFKRWVDSLVLNPVALETNFGHIFSKKKKASKSQIIK